MATYTYPGVYIQEVPKGPGPVQSASASTCAMVGFTEEGPVNEPTLVTSFPEFTSKFGSFTPEGRLPTAAFAYFQNGGQNLIVVRTVSASASSASGIVDEPVVDESSSLSPVPDNAVTAFKVTLSNSPLIPGSLNFDLNFVNYRDDGQGTLRDAADANRGSVDYATGVISLTAVVAPPVASTVLATYGYVNLEFGAKSHGDWANQLSVQIEGDSNSVIGGEFTAYNVNVQRLDADGRFVDVEVFSNVNFLNNDPNFIATRLNDTRRGSDLITVSTGSNVREPVELRDMSTTETLAPVGALDGVNKEFEFTMSQAPATRNGVSVIWHLASSQVFGGGVLAGTVKPVLDVQNQSNLSVTVTTSQGDEDTFVVTQSGLPGTAIVEDFAIDQLDAANKVEGTFTLADAAAGTWTIVVTDTGTNVPTITNVEIQFVRANALSLKDDGLGELVFNPDQFKDVDVSLLAGLNTVNYQTGDMSIGVDINGAGPLNLVGAQTAEVSYTSVNADTAFDTTLSGGSDGAGLLRSEISGPQLAGDELGLFALNRREELLNVCIPDFAANELVSQDLVDYCETRKDRFAIISVPEGYSYTEAIDYKRNTLLRSSSRAAIYYPHLKVIDPVTESEINFPAVAHLAGIYARTDSVKNVSKAPAGTVDGRIAFATGLEVELTPQQAGFVNQANVNNVVSWPYTGLVAWGARTLESNGDFPYIQMRRLFMFVEKSVFNSTQGYVFESNTAGLRSAIKLQVEAFLLGLHRSGHFAGNSPAQSFFVVCDSSNNPQAAIDQGQLVVDVGIAPTKPAEFIIFRFQQKTVD